MKRLFVLLIVLLPITAFVSGCGSSPAPSATPPKEQQEAMKKAQMEMMKKQSAPQPAQK